MALDEYLFGKVASFFKQRNLKNNEARDRKVTLDEHRQRFTILARAITGHSIELFAAEREGGYKGNSFFLPNSFAQFPTFEQNLSYYFYRIIYLSVQKNLKLNWFQSGDIQNDTAQQMAIQNAPIVLQGIEEEFPFAIQIHDDCRVFYQDNLLPKKAVDYSWLYGKVMKDNLEDAASQNLKNFNDKFKTIEDSAPKTTLKSKPVEEIVSIAIDEKQQEDYVLNHNFEKVDTAEEFSGSWRDFDGDDELEDHQEALDELNMKFTVRVDDVAHSVYQSDFIENATVAESDEQTMLGTPIAYPEWDYKKHQYKIDFCKLYQTTQVKSDVDYYKKTLSENASTLLGLRKMLTNVNNKMLQQRRQTQGDTFDIDALTDLFVDVHTGHTPSENIYISNRKKEKDISILLLLDISLSSDSYAAGNRVLDVEKQTAILFGEILNEFNIDFSIDCFYSKTRNYSTYMTLKGFDESWQKAKLKIGAPDPSGYTRIGVALRHSGSIIETRKTKNKWIILLSDGKPNDFDRYEGKYGIQDVKQAIRELGEKQINSYALAIEANAKFYLPQMFGQNHYQILSSPKELITSLVKLYEKIKN